MIRVRRSIFARIVANEEWLGCCLKFGSYCALSSQMRGHVAGPESSFGKLFGTELNLRIAMFADEVFGPYAQLENGSPAAVQDGLWTYWLFLSRAMVIGAAPMKFRGTSSENAFYGCQKDKARTVCGGRWKSPNHDSKSEIGIPCFNSVVGIRPAPPEAGA